MVKEEVPEGELSSKELRALVKAHNKLLKITIPKGSTRLDIIKLIEKSNYTIDHKNKSIKPKVQRGKQITLKKAEEVIKPKPKTELEKQKVKEKKEEQVIAKKKEVREIKKKAIEQQKQLPKKKEPVKKEPVKKEPVKKEPVKKETFNKKNDKVISVKSKPVKSKPVPKDSHVMKDGTIMKNKDMAQKDTNPFIGKSTAPNAKPTYKPKPKPKPKPAPKPKAVKPAPKLDTSKIDTYDKLSKFVMDRTRKSTFEIGNWIKKNKKTKFKSQKEIFKSADNFIKPIMQPLFDMIEKALEGDKPFINNTQYEKLDTLVERVREYMRDKRSELIKNIEPVEEDKKE